MEKLEDCDGYKKLVSAIKHDCEEKCFNPNGCDKEKCGCFHKYCDKFKWIMDRVKHYSEKTGIPEVELLNAWEEHRDYWYMNWYQDSNQPLIKAESVKVFKTVDELKESIGDKGFRCPNCGGVSSNPYECDSDVIVKDIKDGKKRECNWKSYGLFGTLGKGVTVFVKDEIKMNQIFMPVAWEKLEELKVGKSL